MRARRAPRAGPARAAPWLVPPTLAVLAWQLTLWVRHGATSRVGAVCLVLASGVLAWAIFRRGGREPGLAERLAVAAAASAVVWSSVAERILPNRLLAFDLLALTAAASIHATLLLAATRSAKDTRLARRLLALAFSVSVFFASAAAAEGVARLLSPLRVYGLFPDDPEDGLCAPSGREPWSRPQPGCRGEYRHPEFFGSRVEINGLGLRDGLDEATPPGPGDASVLVLGDSFAFGMGVDLDQTFQERLEALGPSITARPLRVFGAATPGFGTRSELGRLREMLPETRPDVVILSLYEGNDFDDTERELRAESRGSEGGAPGRPSLLARLESAVGGDTRANFWRQRSSVAQIALGQPLAEPFLVAALATPPHEEVLRSVDLVFSLLRTLRDECRAAGAALVVLVIPAAVQADEARFDALLATLPRDGREGLSRTAFHQRIVERLSADGFRFVDLLPVLERETRAGRAGYRREGHWNAHGHELAAAELAPTLASLLAPQAEP